MVREVSNRELFERLAKCNLPAGVVVEYRHTTLLGSPLVSANGICVSMNYRRPDECRAALMLIVDQLERQGGAFVRTYAASLDSPELVYTWNGSIADGKWSRWRDKDEVIALASCLIQVLGGELPE